MRVCLCVSFLNDNSFVSGAVFFVVPSSVCDCHIILLFYISLTLW